MSETADDLNPRSVALQLTKYFTCPIDWSQDVAMQPIEHVLYRKWFYTVAAALPGGMDDADCLRSSLGGYCRAPAEDSHEMLALLSDGNDITEAFLSDTKRIADNARYYYEDYAQAYSSACSRLQGIRAQTSSQREKHYALGCKTIEDVRQYSNGKRDVGIMFPTLTPQLQEYAFWLSMAHLFDSTEREHELDAEEYSREADQNRFELAWKQLLGEPQSYRICLDALGPVGFYNGASANFLIFDVSLQSQIFHCYPALEPIPGLSVACVDDLQGLDDCLVEKRPFPFP